MGNMNFQTKCKNIYVFANYLIIKSIFRVLSWIPTSFTEGMSHAISTLWFKFDRFHRDIVFHNLDIAFGHEKSHQEIENIAKKTFYNTTNMVFEAARAFQWNTSEIKKNIRIEGIQHLMSAQKKGKGTLLLTGHVGHWELSLFIADLTPYEITGVYKKQKIAAVEKFVLEKRTSRGGRMYPLKKAIGGILAELDQGNLIGLLIDHNAKTRGVFADFFGKTASTEKGLAQLALSTGAPVVPYFVVKRDGGYVVEVLPEVLLIDTGNLEEDILANTLQYNKIIESVIRRYPDQWLWVHRRWKTRPTEE